MIFYFIFIAALFGVASARALPMLVSRQAITPLTPSQIDTFTVYTRFAGIAFCPASETIVWDCGANCGNITDFKPVASGGNGDSIQFWYVGFSTSLNTVIVAHQGTNRSQLMAVITDLELDRRKLDQSLFPGISDDITVHRGFQDEHAKTASSILSAVQNSLSKYATSSVTIVGHSLGAALSLLESVYLPLHLPKETSFRTVVYGLPRVGNQAFANYVDSNLHITHITNMQDPIPVLPPLSYGYVHPAGEVHITQSGDWGQCPGQDNPSTQCSTGAVPHFYDGHSDNHDGPYNGVRITCSGQ